VPNAPVRLPKLPKPSTRSPGFSSWSVAEGSASGGLLARSESGVAPRCDRGGWGASGSLGIRLLVIWVIFNCFLPRGPNSALRCDCSSPRSIQHRLGKNGSAGPNCTVLTIHLAKCGHSGCGWVDANSTAGGPERSPLRQAIQELFVRAKTRGKGSSRL
jgi:hypothetical protein